MAHSLLLGWWGTISFFMNIVFIVENICAVLAVRRECPAASAELDDYREYALNLLASKDSSTVVEVISSQAGVEEAEARAFVERLRATRA